MFRLNILGTDECFVLGCYSFLYIWRNNAQGLDVQPETPLPGTRINNSCRETCVAGIETLHDKRFPGFEKGRESGVRVFTVDAPIQLKSIALIR